MIYILIAAAVFLLDWNIKNYIERHFNAGKTKDILKGKITLRKQYNKGFSFNILKDKAGFVKKVSAVVFGALVIAFIIALRQKNKTIKKLGLSLCTGGAASNVYDRLKRGYVIDYFTINIKSVKNIVFNLGDIFILTGSLMTFVTSLFHHTEKSPAQESKVLPETTD